MINVLNINYLILTNNNKFIYIKYIYIYIYKFIYIKYIYIYIYIKENI